jgi:hypothetical protein
MSGLTRARQLARVRHVERHAAGFSAAAAVNRVIETDLQISRLKELALAVSTACGPSSGSSFAASGECVARLLAGSVASERQRDRLSADAEIAGQLFASADTRARISAEKLTSAQAADAKTNELRSVLQSPSRGAAQ